MTRPDRRLREKILVAAGYAAISFAYFGWELLPHPGNVIPIANDGDNFVWSFGWWEHALATWTNPLYSHALYAPGGVNLAWTTTTPGLALLFTPLTALAGPVVSYNVAALLAPAASAWTGYLLCRYLTGSLWAAIIGGYLIGFSDAVLRQVQPGNLNLSSVFLFPLIALVVLRYVRGELAGRGLAWRLGVLIAFQLTISTEFAAMATIGLVVALLLAYVFEAPYRTRLRLALGPLAAGYGLALLFMAPFTYYLLFDFESGDVDLKIKTWGTDLLAAFVPNADIGIGGADLGTQPEHEASRSAYLGLPTAIIIALYAARAWRTRAGRFLLSTFAAAFIVTLGATAQVYGHTLFTLPWWIEASHLPGISDALPFRFGLLEALAAGVIVAVWTASTRGLVFKRPYVLPALAAIALVPAVWHPSAFDPRPVERAAFFTTGAYKACIAPGETIAIFPTGAETLLWQAEAGFRFNLAANGIQPFSEFGKTLNRFDADPIVWDLTYASGAYPTVGRLLAFAGAHAIDRFVSLAPYAYPTRSQLAAIGPVDGQTDALIAPGCGKPSLATRDLGAYVAKWETNPRRYESRPTVGWCYGATLGQLPTGLEPARSPTTRIAYFIEGQGVTCALPRPGYTRHGFASVELGVPGGIYPYYSR
jgi:hypothetical protein